MTATKRPQFAALLGQVRNCETLIVSKFDRLGRDAQDVGATVSFKHSGIVLPLGKMEFALAVSKMVARLLIMTGTPDYDICLHGADAQ